MFLVKSLDTGEIESFSNIEDVYAKCEGIDVSDNQYEFYDSDGNIYEVEWIENVKTDKLLFGLMEISTQGKYILKKRD